MSEKLRKDFKKYLKIEEELILESHVFQLMTWVIATGLMYMHDFMTGLIVILPTIYLSIVVKHGSLKDKVREQENIRNKLLYGDTT
jgi:hypothetical protein